MSKRTQNTSIDRLIRRFHNWTDLVSGVESLGTKETGDVFELVVQLYLEIDPRYRTVLRHVWLYDDVPQKVRKHLHLPSRDMGIDLIAETKDGSYWAIQAKYRADARRRMTFRELSTFVALAYTSCRNISYALVCTTTDRVSKELEGQSEKVGLCTSEVWEALDDEFFRGVRARLANRAPKVTPFKPRPHQRRAIKHSVEHFGTRRQSRGKMIHPCGAGKTLTSYWIARELKARIILVAVPSLALISQTLSVWLRESVAAGTNPDWLCVCSDETAGKTDQDELTAHAYELGVPCVTKPAVISDWLREHDRGTRIIFTTYQSGKAIATAARRADITFDLGIMDEAHKTVGVKGKAFAHLLDDKNIDIRRRIFMTATERRYQGSSDKILSMDDAGVYGETFDLVTFKDAIQAKRPILCDYEVLLIAVGKREIAELINEKAFVDPDRGGWNEIDAATLASVVALRKAIQEHPIKHVVSFHRSIKRAKEFQRHNESFSEAMPSYGTLETYHVSSNLRTSERARELAAFVEADRALITNARCLTEGVDLPTIDGVIFADPKRSKVDIVQATGRALRPSKGKEKGFVVVPLVVDGEADTKDLVEASEFKEVLTVLGALASNDSRIVEELRLVANGNRPQKRILRFGENLEEVLATDIDLSAFVQELGLHAWEKLARLAWREFGAARDYARKLGLRGWAEWQKWLKGELEGKPKRPADIPSSPNQVYSDQGWESWGDWLGTGNIGGAREWRDFESARQYARELGLENVGEWNQWVKGELEGKSKRPPDIPSNPQKAYSDQGWRGVGDWLGTGNIGKGEWRDFESARQYARKLGLRSVADWQQWAKGKSQRPVDIPAAPGAIYADQGWQSWGDWLGTGKGNRGEWRDFESARRYARKLGLRSWDEWSRWVKGELEGKAQRPADIPSNPNLVYSDLGWRGLGDWLGTGNVSRGGMRDFESARQYARKLGLRNRSEWQQWLKRELKGKPRRPADIPANPDQVYSHQGWQSWGDWLGTGNIGGVREWRDFESARQYARKLGLRTQHEWARWAKGELEGKPKRPADIPSNPQKVYSDGGWRGVGDWLGTGNIKRGQKGEWRDFESARQYARTLGLLTSTEWHQWSKGELEGKPKRPADIPSNPHKVYSDQGWQRMSDWLGTGDIQKRQKREWRDFESARQYARKLGLRNTSEWREWIKGELRGKPKRPADIPSTPDRAYSDQGWQSWGDWLGTENVYKGEWCDFESARQYARKLGLHNSMEWRHWIKGELKGKPKRPANIPSNPNRIYTGKGWQSWGDWLGTGNIGGVREWRDFESARQYARKLGLRNTSEWRQWVKGAAKGKPKRPADIPSCPDEVYSDQGWRGYSDWLGTDHIRKRVRRHR